MKKRGPGPSKQDHADGLVVVGAQQSQGGGVLFPAFNHKEEVWEEFTTRQGEAKGRWRRGNCVVLSVLKVKVLSVLLSFCSFLLLYFPCLGSVLEKVSGDMKALATLK